MEKKYAIEPYGYRRDNSFEIVAAEYLALQNIAMGIDREDAWSDVAFFVEVDGTVLWQLYRREGRDDEVERILRAQGLEDYVMLWHRLKAIRESYAQPSPFPEVKDLSTPPQHMPRGNGDFTRD